MEQQQTQAEQQSHAYQFNDAKWCCRICLSSDYAPTMITVCGHTFCDECLTKIKECAICRTKFEHYDLQTNYALMHGQHKRKRREEPDIIHKLEKSITSAKNRYLVNKQRRLDNELITVTNKINIFLSSRQTTNKSILKIRIDKENNNKFMELCDKVQLHVSNYMSFCRTDVGKSCYIVKCNNIG